MSISQLRFAALKTRWTELRVRRNRLHRVCPARAVEQARLEPIGRGEDLGEALEYGPGVRRIRHYLMRHEGDQMTICWFEVLWWEESQSICGSNASSPEVWDSLRVPLAQPLSMP
jgi:hypothetical protein